MNPAPILRWLSVLAAGLLPFHVIHAQAPKLLSSNIIRNSHPAFNGVGLLTGKTVADPFGNTFVAGLIPVGGVNLDLKTGNNYFYAGATTIATKGLFLAKYDSLHNLLWAHTFPCSAQPVLMNMETDNAGNVVMAVSLSPLIPNIPPYIDLDTDPNVDQFFYGTSFLARFDPSGNLVFGGKLETGSGYKISFDAANNIFLYGSYSVTIDFDMGPGTATLAPASGKSNAFVAKYSPGGSYLFSGSLSSNNWSESIDLVRLHVTSQNQVILVGAAESYTNDFDLSSSVSTATVSPGFFMAKYDSAFNLVDLQSANCGLYGYSSGYSRLRYAVAADNSSFFVIGTYYGVVDFNFGTGIDTLPRHYQTTNNYFVARYNNSLGLLALKHFGNIGASSPSISSDISSKSLFIGHEFWPAISWMGPDYDPGPAVVSFTGSLNRSFAVARYDSLGSLVTASLLATAFTGNNNLIFRNICFGIKGLTLAGTIIDSVDFDPSAQVAKRKSMLGGLFLSRYSPQLTLIAADANTNRQYSTFNPNWGVCEGTKILKSGSDYYLFGRYEGVVDYNSDPAATFTVPSYNYTGSSGQTISGLFFGKFSSSHTPAYVRQFEGGTGTITAAALAANGDLVIAGNTYQSGLDIDPSQSGVTGLSGTAPTFIARYSGTNGTMIWSKTIQNAYVYDMVLDNNGDVIAVGAFSGPSTFSPSTTMWSSGSYDAYLLKLSGAGSFVAVRSSTCSGIDAFRRVVVDGNNDIVLIGDFAPYSFSFISNVNSFTSSVSGTNGFICKLTSSLVPVFGYCLNGAGSDEFSGLALDAQNNIYATGILQSQGTDFDFGTGTAIPAPGSFLVKYSPSGSFGFVRSINANARPALKIEPASGNIFTFGKLTWTGDYDPGPGVQSINGGFVLAKYDSQGNYLFAERFNKKNPSPIELEINDLIFDNGDALATGFFYINGSPDYPYCNFEVDTNYRHNVAAGMRKDIFVLRYCNTPNAPQIISGATHLCSGGSTTLTSSSSAATWFSSPTSTSALHSGVSLATPSLSGSTTFYVSESNSCGASYRRPVPVTVYSTAAVAITGPGTVCAGSPVTLTGSGAVTYSWSGGPATASMSFTPGASAVYSLSSNNPCGASSATFQVSVFQVPTVAVSTSTNLLCYGTPATLTASGATTYSWSSSQSGASVQVTPTVTTTYTVEGASSQGCINSAVTTISVLSQNYVTISSPGYVCQNNPYNLVGYNAVTYSWSNGATGSTVVITPTLTGTENFTVYGTDANGCTTSGQAWVSVMASPTLFTSPANPTTCTGPVTLAASGASSYTWLPGPSFLSSAIVSPAISTIYTVTGKWFNNCTSTRTVLVNVTQPPVIGVTGSGTAICAGNTATLQASGAVAYTWSPGGTGSSITVTPGGTTNYSITASDSTGCKATATLQLIVHPLPTLTPSPPSPTACAGQSITLNASGANTYTWSNNAVSSSITVSQPGTYSVTGSNAQGCQSATNVTVVFYQLPVLATGALPGTICKTQSASLSVSGASTYTWSNLQTGSTIVVSPPSTAIYSVAGTDINGCVNTGTVSLTVNANPSLSVMAPQQLCAGENLTLTASGASQYTWTNGPAGPVLIQSPVKDSVFVLTGISVNSCASTVTVSLTISPCTGIAGELRGSFDIYPNPFLETFSVYSPSPGATIRLYTATGQLVLVSRLAEGLNLVHAGLLAKGLYLACISSGENVVVMEKIIRD